MCTGFCSWGLAGVRGSSHHFPSKQYCKNDTGHLENDRALNKTTGCCALLFRPCWNTGTVWGQIRRTLYLQVRCLSTLGGNSCQNITKLDLAFREQLDFDLLTCS